MAIQNDFQTVLELFDWPRHANEFIPATDVNYDRVHRDRALFDKQIIRTTLHCHGKHCMFCRPKTPFTELRSR